MTTDLALEYIPRRMKELGYGDAYHLRFRHLRLLPGDTRTLWAFNQLLVLIDPPEDISVESMQGIFHLGEDRANEMQYEHRGHVSVKNLSVFTSHVKMIQVIPKYMQSNNGTQ